MTRTRIRAGGVRCRAMARPTRSPLRWWPGASRKAELAVSERLVLTALRIDDALDHADSLRDPEVAKWQGYDEPAIERLTLGLSRSLSYRFRGNPMELAVRDRTTGAFVGTFAYVQDVTDLLGDSVILGWWLVAEHRGRGLGHESLQMVLRWLHDEVLVGTIRMGTISDNVRAVAQIERAGARLQHEHPTLLPNGTAPMGKWYVHEL